MTRQIACLLLLGLVPAPAVANATDEGPSGDGRFSVRVGFDGHYKVGVWTPVEITFHDPGQRAGDEVIVTVPDGDAVPSRVRAPISAAQESVILYVRFGRVDSQLAVEISREDKVVFRRVFQTNTTADGIDDSRYGRAIAATRQLIVSVGDDPLGVQDAIDLLNRKADRRPVAVKLENCRQLPDKWYGYEGVETLLLSTSRPEVYADLDPGGLQITALDEWIRMGGKLVLCIGSSAEQLLGDDGPLRVFAPGSFREMIPLRRVRAFEEYASSSAAVPRPADGAGPFVRAPMLTDVEGVVEAHESKLPLVVRTPRGFGQIIFFAADLDRPPLGQWKDRPLLVHRLLDLPEIGGEELEDDATLMHFGFNDVSGQLRSALDQFSNVRMVPFWVVVALLVVYLLLIGPGDYFFLRKVARRMQWAWITFPAIVLAVCLLAFMLAHFLKGNQLRFNQMDLVDVDVASQRVRGTSWANIFCPPAESLQTLSLRPNLPAGRVAPDAGVLFSWMGLPGRGLGGMDPRTSNPVLWHEKYDFSPHLGAMHDVPIQAWATKSFVARWNAQATTTVTAELIDDGEGVSGTISNKLGFALSNCVLAYDRYAYMLDTLAADGTTSVDAWVIRSELRTWLTQRRIETAKPTGSKGSYHAISKPYDQSSVELAASEANPWPDILRAMMFFEATGGRRYTRLSNGYQRFVDLSSLLKAGRAVLVARAAEDRHGAELLRNDKPLTDCQDKHTTVFRFVLPVKKANSQ